MNLWFEIGFGFEVATATVEDLLAVFMDILVDGLVYGSEEGVVVAVGGWYRSLGFSTAGS